jgi:hypothetical protein
LIIKKFEEYIKEDAEYSVPGETSPLDAYFDSIQDSMKNLLIEEKGFDEKTADLFVTNNPEQNPISDKYGLVYQFANKIKMDVKDLFNKNIPYDKAAHKLLFEKPYNYYKKSAFNNKGNIQEPNKITGDRSSQDIV